MNKQTIATILGSALLGGGTVAITENVALQEAQTELTVQKDAKHEIIKDNVWKDVRLGEIPEWDISVVSADELSAAYVELATEKNAKQKSNLFEGLREKAVSEGVICR